MTQETAAKTANINELLWRKWIVPVSLAIWLLPSLFGTGVNLFAAFAANALVFTYIAVATLPTSTIGWRLPFRAFCFGGAAMGVMVLFYQLLLAVFHTQSSVPQIIVGTSEELLKLAPVLALLYLRRKSTSLALGVSDVLLMGAASGAGFALVEEAWQRQHGAYSQTLPLFPICELTPNDQFGSALIAGHLVWTTIAAATVGFAWLYRRGAARNIALLTAVSGCLWTIMGHTRNNIGGSHFFLLPLLNLIDLAGYTTFILFIACIGGAIYFDRRAAKMDEADLPPVKAPALSDFRQWLRFNSWKNALAYSAFRFKQTDDVDSAIMVQALMRKVAPFVAMASSDAKGV